MSFYEKVKWMRRTIVRIMAMFFLLGCAPQANFPDLQSVPHAPEEVLNENNGNRPSIIIEQD